MRRPLLASSLLVILAVSLIAGPGGRDRASASAPPVSARLVAVGPGPVPVTPHPGAEPCEVSLPSCSLKGCVVYAGAARATLVVPNTRSIGPGDRAQPTRCRQLNAPPAVVRAVGRMGSHTPSPFSSALQHRLVKMAEQLGRRGP